MIGLAMAGILRLDVFQAAAAAPSSDGNSAAEVVLTSSTTVAQPEQGSLLAQLAQSLPGLGVAVTGLLIGLGSSPTHEVIQSLKEYKKSRVSANNPSPQMNGGAGGEANGVTQLVMSIMPAVTAAGKDSGVSFFQSQLDPPPAVQVIELQPGSSNRARRPVSTFSLRRSD
jgi:hypothetical protein